jgi:hypothetical protein
MLHFYFNSSTELKLQQGPGGKTLKPQVTTGSPVTTVDMFPTVTYRVINYLTNLRSILLKKKKNDLYKYIKLIFFKSAIM